MMQKRWHIRPYDAEQVRLLQQQLGSSEIICRLLQQRGITDYEQAKEFFNPDLANLHDPWLMKDMHKAVDRIVHAIDNGERVMIYGDYDVDGTTSVATMYQFLNPLIQSELLQFYIPNRYREGYGISKIGIDYAKAQQIDLIISLDCGIKSVELVNYAQTLGIDFIICDHHLPDEVLPNAVAILNPKQKECLYPYKDLCGCGVGFKLMSALAQRLSLPFESVEQYLDLVATAIAADIVPMTGENRILAFHGLKKINSNPSIGIQAIMDVSQITPPLTISNVVFMIAPRVNAAGRMDDAKKAVQLFVERDKNRAKELALLLQSDNNDRKEADSSITEEALQLIAKDPTYTERKSTVVYAEHWHKGVVGIVASRLIETHYKPTVVLTRNGNYVTGSARSVPGFNLYEAIHACREHLVNYGGHFAAAGLTLLPEKVDVFSALFDMVVKETIAPELLIPLITIDAALEPEQISMTLYNTIKRMEPFGPENLKPVFMIKNVIAQYPTILKEKHLKFVIAGSQQWIQVIAFNMGHLYELVTNSKPIDIAFQLEENNWNGQRTLQLKVVDIKPANN